MTPDEQLIADVGKFHADPLGFTRYAFPWGDPGELEKYEGPRDFQVEALDTIGKHLRSDLRFHPLQLAICSGHGIGKSALIGFILNWAMSTCDDCRCIVTAGKESQLVTKTWPEISKWFRLVINAHWWMRTATKVATRDPKHADSWRIDRETWSEQNTDAFAGLHNQGKRIVIIFDESSSIADKVWEVTEGALTDELTEIIWVAFGNANRNVGRFAECFGRFKHRWVQKQIDSRLVEGTNKELFDKWVADWGEDSDFVRVRVRGEFPRAGSSQFIGGEVVAAARKRKVPSQSHAWKILSVDVARFGDDQSVIGWRQGLLAKIRSRFRGLDTQELGARVVDAILAENPRSCVIDGDGVGGGVVDYVDKNLPDEWRRKNPAFQLHEFHGAGTPGDGFMYFNKRAECWGLMRTWLEEAQIPDEPELEDDLTGPDYFHSNKNQIQLERKDDMKARGLSSPDLADMLMMTFAVTPAQKTREEKVAEEIAATTDPMEKHFMRLRETERRKEQTRPLNYWE